MIKKLSKDKVKKLIDENRITIYYEKNWKYPATGDDQRSCPMLDAMFSIERRGGYLIHIPCAETKEEIEGKRQLKGQKNFNKIEDDDNA